MTELLASPYILAAIFFIVAFVYSSVGLGGGSSYTALLVIAGMGSLQIPLISLTLNLIVTTVGSVNFLRQGHGSLRLIAPFLVSSIPMAYLGGTLKLPIEIFQWLLLISLVFVAARIYLWKETGFQLDLTSRGKLILSLIAGGILGLLAGIVGIGGGIYLVPLIIVLGLGTAKEAAACGAIFIWLNSAAGLTSRLQHNFIDISDYIPLIVATLIGGILGSWLGSSKLSARTMEKTLGVIILVAIAFLFRSLLL